MALLTAEDVFNKKFTETRLRNGYDQDEVDDFLDEVVNTLRELNTENEELRRKLEAAERRVADLSRASARREAEQPKAPEPAAAPIPEPAAPVIAQPPAPAPMPAPQAARPSEPDAATGMLSLAQKLHDDYVRSGQEQHDQIVNEARAQAAQIVRDAENKHDQTLAQLEKERALLERKIDELRVFERDYRTRLKAYLENLLIDIDGKAQPTTPPRPMGAPAPAAPTRETTGFQY